jgi:hypothetical protein
MIVQIVKDIAEALPVTESPNTFATFKHGEKEFQNYIADELEGVLIFLDEPITSNDSIKKGGYIEEEYPISMIFADKTELDWTPEQHQEVILEMRALAKRFINRLVSSQLIRRVNPVVTRVDFKNLFNSNISGVILRITIVPFNDDSACL